ncbi:MAG: hypothetical protein HY848_12855 [Betaproteobacteria bacterium]|nr:hypothetical protein [Betaproteobacteria bacterium]
MTRLLQWIVLAVTSGTCVAAYAAQGETKVPSPTVNASRQLVEQKAAFLKRVLSDSPAIRRIEAGNNAEARKFLASAQENFRNAVLSIKNNDIAGADKHLNQATWLIGKARQLVPDPLARNVEHRVRYAQMLDSVESLRISYQRHLQRARPQPPEAAANDALLVKVAQLVDRAKGHAESEQVVQANKSLAEAERTLMMGLGRVLGSKTIEYVQRFETLAEEYANELERNRSYADLIPIALDGFKPGGEAVREARQFVDANRGLREQAQRHAAAKDYHSALTALRSGTAQLQSALAAAGLRVPQDPRPQ